jgi:hypothetical protein
MAKMTISIPDELRKRMDRVRQDINWSAVAAESFEGKLREVNQLMRQEKIMAVVRQLRQKSATVTRETLASVAERQNEFIEQICYQAEWREGKASQFPDDHRNVASAESLRQLAHELDSIAPNDELWVRYHRVWKECSDSTALVEYESEVRREYGFSSDKSPVTTKDAVRFLRAHVEALEQLVAESKFDDE